VRKFQFDPLLPGGKLLSGTIHVILFSTSLFSVTAGSFSITNLDQSDVSPVLDKITWSIADADQGAR
jgi:glucosamine--fructose-6-phosphate aminotransferase (isomerizing)